MNSHRMAAPARSVRVCRQLTAFTEIFLFLQLVHLQYQYFLVNAGTSTTRGSQEIRALHVENRHAGPWNWKAGAADTLGLPVVVPSSGEGSRSALQVANRHAGRNWKRGAADESFGFAAVEPRSGKTSHGRRSLTRDSDVTNYSGLNTTRPLEVEALISFKAAITSDPFGTLGSWTASANDSNACGWTGVVCSPQQPKQLISLALVGYQLEGNFNLALQALGELPFLQRLDLSANAFSGSFPTSPLANCSNLSYLNVSSNHLTGKIPSQLGELINLQALDLGGNNLTGEIPVSLGNCTLLRILDLGLNLLHGEIPPVLGVLSRLEFLDLASTVAVSVLSPPVDLPSLSGSLPPALGNCSSLTFLSLNGNGNLGGELPTELSQLKSLQVLLLSACNFEGALPNWLVSNLTALTQLSLSYNIFHGEIPDAMGQLRNLSSLILGGNNLTGEIPISITNCTTLTFLTVENNGLTGNISPQIGLLRNLEVLSLFSNNFSGVIPDTLSNCSALAYLELGNNPFDPQIIPSWIGSFSNLVYLYFAEMNLQGGIPKEIGRLSNLQELYLRTNNLGGVIPPILGNLSLLDYLDLLDNQLTGDIPSDIGNLPYMTELLFSQNFFTGSFPASIANLTEIRNISFEVNLLNGSIDFDFGRLSQLQIFDVGTNHFSGPIPRTLSNCSGLYYIDLYRNRLEGDIPPSLGNLTSLEQLWLGSNMIEGTIPVDLMRCTLLGLLDVQANFLKGDLLPNIGQLSSLQNLYLSYNNFTGIVPSSLGNCSGLTVLDLSYNQFIGNVPGNILSKMSSSLTSLNLSNNFFSGSWPAEISELKNIQIIDVSANNISGSIPSSLESCTALVSLDVSINNLTGAIPQSLGSLTALRFFNASYNNFQGPIPDTGAFKTILTKTSFLGNPGLCGSILGPGQECAAPSVPHKGASERTCEGFNCRKVWIPTTCGIVGIVLIVVGVLRWVNTIYGTDKRNKVHLMLNFASYMRFSEEDVLRTIEGDGGKSNIIGVGAKSVVYKGVLPGGELFALKIIPHSEDNEDAHTQLLKEVHTLAQLRHRNILKVLSFCSTLDMKAMILEYMPEGSLHKHLHELQENDHDCKLPWHTRFNIAMGVAEAMVYLHHDFPEPLIHRDLKPSNILLDTEFDPKLCDFGISKFTNPSGNGEATTSLSRVCGTIGYMAPEYAMGTSASTKGDVYSYGMVLLELLTRRQPHSGDNSGPNRDCSLKGWVMESFEERPFELLDSALKQEGLTNSNIKDQMMLLMRVALFCTREAPQSRPSMSDVLAMLKQIKEVGAVPITPRTTEDLANDTTIWTDQNPSDTSLPSF